MNNLFVYGTLRKGRLELVMPEVAPYLKVRTKGYVNGKLFDTGEYPAAIKNGRKKVYGEIFEIDPDKIEDVLTALDEYEDFFIKAPSKSLFLRDVVNVKTPNGNKTQAWIYWYNKDTKKFSEIKDGIYRKRKNAITVNQ